MSWHLATASCALLLACAPPPAATTPTAHESEPDSPYHVLAHDGVGVRVLIVNHTDSAISELGFIGRWNDLPAQDSAKVVLAPHGGSKEFRIRPDKLKDHQLGLTADGPGNGGIGDVIVGLYDSGGTRGMRDDTVTIDGATEVDISDRAEISGAPKFGLKRVVLLTDKAYAAKRQADFEQGAAEQAAICQPMVDAAGGKPRPGKTAVRGLFKCVIAGGIDSTSKVQVVQLASGKITATVSEIADARTYNSTWEGIIAGSHLRFRYPNAASAGDLEIDPGGHALIGKGVSLVNNVCVEWTMTCTR